MINFYSVWKEDKSLEPKRKKSPKSRCIICGSRVLGLKDHMEGVHGKGTWSKMKKAEEIIAERNRIEIIKIMEDM